MAVNGFHETPCPQCSSSSLRFVGDQVEVVLCMACGWRARPQAARYILSKQQELGRGGDALETLIADYERECRGVLDDLEAGAEVEPGLSVHMEVEDVGGRQMRRLIIDGACCFVDEK